MTYEELLKSMTNKERFVNNQILYRMRTDEEGYWYNCLWNRMLYRLATMILGRDAFDFVWDNAVAIGEEEIDLDATKEELDALRKAFN